MAVDIVVVVEDEVFGDFVVLEEEVVGGEDSGEAAVAVEEWMDVGELVMEDAAFEEGVNFLVFFEPLVEFV